MRAVAATALVAVLAFLGCGGSDGPSPEEEVRATASQIAVALGSGNTAEACAMMTGDYRASFESEELDIQCEDLKGEGALGSPLLEGLEIAAVAVDEGKATVTFAGSPVVFELEETEDGWRLSSLGD